MRKVAFVLAALVLATAVGLATAEDKKDQITFAAFARDTDNTQHIFYRNNDGHIMELWAKHGDTKGWNSKDLTAAANAPKAASGPTAYLLDKNNTQHVVYRGEDGNIYELYFRFKDNTQDKWQVNNLTQAAGAPKAAGNPAGYIATKDNTQHVVFRSTDGDIIELFNATTGDLKGWKHLNLTAEAKAPKAAGNPDGYFLKHDNTQHVVYRDKDGNIQELYLKYGQDRWMTSNLTTQTKAPKADGDPSGYVMESDNTQHVVFRSADGDVIELYNVPSDAKNAGWHMNNLTAATKTPKAAGNPVGYYVGDDKTEHVLFRDKDGNIQELYLRAGQDRWMSNNLTSVTKAPAAASDPVGYYLDKDNTQHVVFRTKDGAIYELFFRPKGDGQGWHSNNLTAAARSGG